MTPPTTQTDFLTKEHSLEGRGPHFSEVCNALYERELAYLAQHGPAQVSLFRRKLASLSHYIKHAAYFLADNQAPIEVDIHNASWQAKQARRIPLKNNDREKNFLWFEQHAKLGLVLAVRLQHIEGEYFELDSIDKVQVSNHSLHLNKHGWFDFHGHALGDNLRHGQVCLADPEIMKPNKAIMSAACCGHSWNHKGRISPRTLTLRELLLSININWGKFTLLEKPNQTGHKNTKLG